ncbi:4-(cytidine 5'-diphospho)-2-C-methyl-D-erythritol kinase [Pseudoalteromonas ruthenica]|uniref:4-diphosphocytidyl-2-C-methyl-D-erythritol kinase n=1 Tax=Pseudoalteromonas ruthenica TaxID=151081 RepID=A0A0F4PSJ5_9GAMM|nr:4-(cytidine 5'-diphospho)-2-C-methyl-D-erythritol kinase [Pseudoalteromonas ruthenica]KJY96452.1 kinase [Pseudoalteromonas ruthenica]KJY97993.1 kinase [Pseudoalteromonas ruthenica]TMO85043.1 4-(cytidine 5'-diphospho)-2-C-methyl-D-erythritol kinase [Pseudoalteromonas ruthenica]TMO90697.1 4-(cytidine 5'-diphospho)-2-C-methyl-D-erythritol kinase [Pseudoalteromonas ruthenica]TMO97342.1 4-(cytidine 5'-diphospho)-2-C-methyl-D-erythritol kinase [Pseudoalteromonas ruthenica]
MNSCALSVIAPAKLNLFLHITGRRDDGYHELETLFTFLDHGDELHFQPRQDSRLELAPMNGVANEDNLIFRAGELLRQAYQQRGLEVCGVNIDIDKRLPMGGGVGGGSSDAATTLLALNSLWGNKLSLDELAELGIQLGADVPVFIGGSSALARGVGEQLQAVDVPQHWYLVVHPQVHISTAAVFGHPDLPRDSAPLPQQWQHAEHRNDCEALVKKLYSEVEKTLQWLLKYAPSRMTGTGACCFAAFDSERAALDVLEKLPTEWQGFVAKSLNQSPAHTALGLN